MEQPEVTDTQTAVEESATEKTPYRPLLDILVEHVGKPLPDGYDAWGMRTVWPDFQSSHGYRWPFPGNVAESAGPFLHHRGSCPNAEGDGICVALTASGMASGGIPAGPVLLTAHKATDVLGDSEPGKLRLRAALVVDVVHLGGAYLRGADLGGADLRGADLRGAYLRGAYLRGAYLGGALNLTLPPGWCLTESGIAVPQGDA
jgi:hypothetical protein